MIVIFRGVFIECVNKIQPRVLPSFAGFIS